MVDKKEKDIRLVTAIMTWGIFGLFFLIGAYEGATGIILDVYATPIGVLLSLTMAATGAIWFYFKGKAHKEEKQELTYILLIIIAIMYAMYDSVWVVTIFLIPYLYGRHVVGK